jgi:REP-associated tyrosine transposase
MAMLFDGNADEALSVKRTGVFHQLVYHFTWATKNRECLLTPAVEERLLAYIRFKCEEMEYVLYAVNGAENHVHVLVALSPTMVVAEVAKNLKGASSHYINKESGLNETLYWQDGYGVVTLGKADIPRVVEYIKNQKEHHRAGTLIEALERAPG